MLDCDFLIIGGGVAAYNGAKRIRRAKSDARVVMVSADALPPYSLPPLSKEFLRGEQSETDIVYPVLAAATGSMDTMLSTSVVEIDPVGHEAILSDGRRVGFGKALLATGASPIPLPVPGAELRGVFYLRSADDSTRLAGAAASARNAVVIGAGFIGLEVAASLRGLGLEVTVIEAEGRIWPRFADANVADVVRSRCAKEDIKFLTGERVVGVNGDGHVRSVSTSGGLHIDCDLVCIGIGIKPNTDLASAAGLEIENGIVVDALMRTSAPDIFAAGDVISFPDPIARRRTRAEHWGHAEYSGQLAGDNMAGRGAAYDFMSYAWSDVFDLHIDLAGYIDVHDEVVVRGDQHGNHFTSLYLREGALVGYCAINSEPVEFATYRRMIRSRQPLSNHIASLRDSTVNIKSLIQA